VLFDIFGFCVPIKRPRYLRRKIYAKQNIGFVATQNSLRFGQTSLPTLQLANREIEFGSRKFIVESDFEIKFSTPFDNQDFVTDGGGVFKVDERFGKILGLELLLKKLLVIQEFGLSTLDAAFDPSQFNMQVIARSFEKNCAEYRACFG